LIAVDPGRTVMRLALSVLPVLLLVGCSGGDIEDPRVAAQDAASFDEAVAGPGAVVVDFYAPG
jgi:hypothetical protein